MEGPRGCIGRSGGRSGGPADSGGDDSLVRRSDTPHGSPAQAGHSWLHRVEWYAFYQPMPYRRVRHLSHKPVGGLQPNLAVFTYGLKTSPSQKSTCGFAAGLASPVGTVSFRPVTKLGQSGKPSSP